MTRLGTTLFETVSCMPIRDWYATPNLQKRVLTNITELIKTPQKDTLISLFDRDEKCDISSLSDFEYFKTLVMHLPKWIGTLEGALAREELLSLTEKPFAVEEMGLEKFVHEAWQIGNERLAKCGGTYEAFLSNNGVEKLYQRRETICSFKCVEKYNNEKILTLLCNLRGHAFVRPDPYHAALAEEKYRRGERLSSNEESMLISQAIYLHCMNEHEHKIEIHLLADGDGQSAVDLIAHLKRWNVCGHVWIAADGEMENDVLMELCSLSDDCLSVRPEIVLGKTDSARNLEKRLSALAAVYPISLWRFGGVLTQSPLFIAGHMHARRVICDLIAETVQDANEALALAKKIFTWE